MIATIANTSIVFRCFELRSFPIKSIDASMPQSSVEANIAARSAGNSEFCDIARRMPGIAIEMKAPAIPTRMVAVKQATKEYLISPDLDRKSDGKGTRE